MELPKQQICNERSLTAVVPSAPGKPVFDAAAATTSSCGHSSHQQGLSEPMRPEGSSSLCCPRTSTYIQPSSPTVSELDCAITGATTATELARACGNSSLPSNLVLRTSALDFVVRNTVRRRVTQHSETDVRIDRGSPCNGSKAQANLQEDIVDIVAGEHEHLIPGTRSTVATSRYPLISGGFPAKAQTDAAVTLKRREQHRHLAELNPLHPRTVSCQPDAVKHPGHSADDDAPGELNLYDIEQGPVNAHVHNSPSARGHLLPSGRFLMAASIKNLTSTAAEDCITGHWGNCGEQHGLDWGRKRPRQPASAHDGKCDGTAVEKQRRLPRIAQPTIPEAGNLLQQCMSGTASWEVADVPRLEALAAAGHPVLATSLELLGAQPLGAQLGQPTLLAERLVASSGLRGQAPDARQRQPEQHAGGHLDLDLEHEDRRAHDSSHRRRRGEAGETDRQTKSRQQAKRFAHFHQQQPDDKQREPRSLSAPQYGQEEQLEQERLVKDQDQGHGLLLRKDWTGCQEPAVEALQESRAAVPTVAKVRDDRASARDGAAATDVAAAVAAACPDTAGDTCEEARALRTDVDPASDVELARLLIAALLPRSSNPSLRPAGREALHEALIFLTTRYYMERGLPRHK
ncbi:hypothetical protein Vafri_13469 [Volvox africanus]|nr:hypothetical protein Vafri_13469 [Volvox africanus]